MLIRMPLRKRTRRVLLSLGSLLAILAVAVLSLPLWFPLALRPVARKLGASYGRYERVGYSKFAVQEATLQGKGSELKARRVEGLLPTVWLWHLAFGQEKPLFLRVEDWDYFSYPSESSPPKSKPEQNGTIKLERTLDEFGRWIPKAELTHGAVHLNSLNIVAPELVWSNQTVTGTASVDYGTKTIPMRVAAGPAGTNAYSISLSSEPLQLVTQTHVALTSSRVEVKTDARWWDSPIEASATFVAGQGFPEKASLKAPNLHVPLPELGLPQYTNLAGAVSANWQDNQFVIDAEAQAEPTASGGDFPPLNLNVHARGDTNQAFIAKASLTSPWLRLDLSRQVEVHFKGPLLQQPATLSIAADLADQPWFKAQGKVEGRVELRPGKGEYPVAAFQVKAGDLEYAGLHARSVDATGVLDWPMLELEQATAALAGGSTATLRASMDLEKRTVKLGRATIQGPFLAGSLPPGVGYQGLRAQASFAGPISALDHRGSIEITNFVTPWLKPVTVEAQWQGVQTNLSHVEIGASTGAAALRLQGSLGLVPKGARLDVGSLQFTSNAQPCLSATSPFTVKATSNGPDWEVGLSPVRLGGPGGEIALEGGVVWPARGHFQVSVQNVSSALAGAFLKTDVPEIELLRVEGAGGWTNGPVRFRTHLHARGKVAELEPELSAGPMDLRLEASATPSGLEITNLNLANQTSSVVKASGVLPLQIVPNGTGSLLRFEEDKPLQLVASTAPDAFFWKALAERTGVLLKNPQVHVQLRGSWDKPAGEANVRADIIQLPTGGKRMPTLSNVELALQIGPKEARVESGQILVQGQRVQFSAEMPLRPEFWKGLSHPRVPDWRSISARLQIQDAQIAAFAPLFPNLLAPQGELNADVALVPGGQLSGEIHLARGRTRPLGNTGPISDITAEVRLHDQTLELTRASGKLGGSTISLNGGVHLGGNEWMTNGLPPFVFSVQGQDVPLARQPDYILRGDLLLGVAKTNGAPALISGTARLHDSYYLSDLRALIPGKVARPSTRPPYFSIEDPLVADWRLAVDIQGTNFIKLRTPLFAGQVSANLKLEGTLKDPIVLGDVKTDSGLVRFPFASLQIQEGLVNLTSQDPYHPQLLVHATSKQFGYDIRMNVTGPVDNPVIQFSSTPPLSSEQILLMVSAGELPQGTFSLTPQQRAQTLALFLGRDLLSKLGIGDQSEQRLSIKTGEEISEQGRPTYHIEYKLSDRWSVTGEYDRFGDYNAGLKWRVYSR